MPKKLTLCRCFMTKVVLASLAGLLSVAVLSLSPRLVSADAEHMNYIIPPSPGTGDVAIVFDLGPGTKLDLRFLFGGSQDLRIKRILSTDYEGGFDMSPHDVNTFFALNPASFSEASQFTITVANNTGLDQHLFVTAVWKQH